ncbi:hypothetical protein [Atopobacter phocae]|uniref:hypothetical protein n=1 Tax=Atopobacter phocae TaxID=136492 RepID=UPI0012EB1117|nr:hypothetical protein [Atopobacter phocae]
MTVTNTPVKMNGVSESKFKEDCERLKDSARSSSSNEDDEDRADRTFGGWL